MNTKNTSDKDSEEYELPEEQFGEEMGGPEFQEQQAPQPPKKTVWKRLPKKKIILGLFVLLMIGLVYQFLNRQEKALQPAQLEAGQVEKPAAVAKPTTVVTPTAVTASVAPEQTAQVESLLKEQQLTGASQNQELQAELQGVKQSVHGLQSSLLTLAGSLESVSRQVETIKAQPPAAAAVIPMQIVPGVVVRKVYYLKAIEAGRENIRTTNGDIVPIKVDRAYLVTPDGESLSVKVGDQLRGYGGVTAINADQGWVAFSSGAVIKYGPHDS